MTSPFELDQTAVRLVQVGSICAQWSTIEFHISIAIWALLNLERDTGAIVTGGLDLLPRLNMAINLCKHLEGHIDLLTVLQTTRKQVQDGLDEQRNRAIHGVWFNAFPGQTQEVEVHRGKGGRRRSSVTNEELHKTSVSLNKLAHDLHEVIERLGFANRYPEIS